MQHIFIMTHPGLLTKRCRLTWVHLLQLVIYGVDAAFVPIENVLEPSTPGAIHNITEFLSVYLVPGGPNIPISAIIAAVQDGYVAQVAAAFDEAVENGYISELITLLQQVRNSFHQRPTLSYSTSCAAGTLLYNVLENLRTCF